MRDLIVFAIVMLGLPLAFRRPYFGLLLFSWLAYMRPQDLCWGFARTMRFSMFVAVVMLVGWLVNESGRRRFTVWDIRTRAMLALAALVSVSFVFAQEQGAYEVQYFVEFLKIIVIALFTAGQVSDRQRLRWMLWTITICLGFYGFKGGLFGMLSGGSPILRGPGGMLEDNNDFALALVMNLPMLWYMGSTEKVRWIRRATMITAGLTVVAILLTHSRGAFLAMVGTMMWIAWRSGNLFRASITLAVMGLLFIALAPASVIDRIATITEGSEESSAGARIRSWTVASRMIKDNPGLGVGLRNFQPRYREYAGNLINEDATTYVAHNSYLQIWAESGTPAFCLYMLLLLSVFVTCLKVFRWSKARGVLWGMDYARMLEATNAGFMVGAVFLNRGHFDLIYHWFALVTAFALVARREILQGYGEVATDRVRGVEVRRRSAGRRPRPTAFPAPAGARATVVARPIWGPIPASQFRSGTRLPHWQRTH